MVALPTPNGEIKFRSLARTGSCLRIGLPVVVLNSPGAPNSADSGKAAGTVL